MVAPDNDPTNINTYSGYDDPTGVPSPGRNSEGTPVATRQISQADYDAMDAAGTLDPNVVYVIPSA